MIHVGNWCLIIKNNVAGIVMNYILNEALICSVVKQNMIWYLNILTTY